jgi:hypothetical protein
MRAKEYVDQVLRYMEADEAVKRRLAVDLLEHIQAAGGDEAITRMGDPKDMAAELMDTLYSDKAEIVRELIKTKAALYRYNAFDYEYISKHSLFGLPLVHIRIKYGRGSMSFKPAKGIIAIGLTSVGVISIGTFSAGIISFGALSAGLLAFGGLALGGFALGGVAVGLAALGGLALGIIAWGGLAIGKYALGGAAIASHIAVGGWASGTVAIGNTAVGEHTIAAGDQLRVYSAVSKQEAQMLIERVYPNTKDFIVRLMTAFFR